jgi:hypothetical protein
MPPHVLLASVALVGNVDTSELVVVALVALLVLTTPLVRVAARAWAWAGDLDRTLASNWRESQFGIDPRLLAVCLAAVLGLLVLGTHLRG